MLWIKNSINWLSQRTVEEANCHESSLALLTNCQLPWSCLFLSPFILFTIECSSWEHGEGSRWLAELRCLSMLLLDWSPKASFVVTSRVAQVTLQLSDDDEIWNMDFSNVFVIRYPSVGVVTLVSHLTLVFFCRDKELNSTLESKGELWHSIHKGVVRFQTCPLVFVKHVSSFLLWEEPWCKNKKDVTAIIFV